MDVSEYWKKRGPGYYEELQNVPRQLQSRFEDQEKHVIKLLQTLKFNKILEIGCGSGRYTKILSEFFKPEKYVAIDISKEQLENAKKYVSNDKIDFCCTQVQDLIVEEKFDLVFASEVLMHINFNDIEKVIGKLVSFSTNKIISIDWYNKKNIGNELSGYCFMHDYENLFRKNGAKNVRIHILPISLSWKLLSAYAKFRGRYGVDTQAIIEVDV